MTAETHPDIEQRDASVGALLSDVAADISLLMRQEVELAKAEVRQSAASAGRAAGMLGGAGVAGHLALLFLSVALWWGLGSAIDNLGWSALVVGALWALVAAVLAYSGRRRLTDITGIPQTVDTAKRVPAALKGDES